MKLLLSLMIFPFFCAVAANAESAAATRPALAAEINGVGISKERLDKEIIANFKIDPTHLDDKALHEVRKQILNRLIERELLIQAARVAKLFPSEDEARELISQAKGGFATEDSYQTELSASGLDEKTLVVGVREDLAIKRYLEQHVFSVVQISEQDVVAAFERDRERFAAPEEIRARHIFFHLPSDSAPGAVEAVLTKAAEVRDEARQPDADFARLARKYSEAPNRAKGGDLGYFTANQMPEAFSEAVFRLPVGEVSELIRTEKGVHIVLVENRRGGNAVDFQAAKAKIQEQLTSEAREKALTKKLEQLRHAGKVIVYLN